MDDKFFKTVGTEAEARRQVKATAPASSPSTMNGVSSASHGSGTISVRRWSQNDNIFWAASQTRKTLEPGFYGFGDMPNIGVCVVRSSIALDNLIELPDTASAEVLAEFAAFWTLGDRFAERGFLHKRGILLWGPPGSGKTSSLMLMAARLVAQGGIVCKIDHPGLAGTGLSMIRRIEPTRPIVAILEDLDALIARYGENEYLALLDGETQVDKIVYIATTNYPERLDRRFVDRPSRFDTVRWIGMPSAAARRIYLQAKEPSLSEDEVDRWVRHTDGFSIAHLRELIILVQCFGESLAAAVARLEKMRVRRPSSEEAPDRQPFGIVA